MVTSLYRGHKIYAVKDEWYYLDTAQPVALFKDRPCGNCGNKDTDKGHDSCISDLPCVMNACCGHGGKGESYVQFFGNVCIRGNTANAVISILKIIKRISKKDKSQ